jgi:hypothetical protein
VILKRMDLGEADRIVTLFSRDEGKIRAVAKGVRRTTSRSAGHLEPFTLSDVLFAVGRELDVISQADTLEAFRTLRENLELTTHAYYLAEVVDLLTEDHLENRAVFDTLVEGLHQLAEAADTRLVLIGPSCASASGVAPPSSQTATTSRRSWAACCVPAAATAKRRPATSGRPRSSCCGFCSSPAATRRSTSRHT